MIYINKVSQHSQSDTLEAKFNINLDLKLFAQSYLTSESVYSGFYENTI